MGHLINPHLVRLGINNYSDTRWLSFSNVNHSYLITHDLFIHMYMKWFFRDNKRRIYLNNNNAETYVSHYVILRTVTSVNIIIICRMLDDHERWCNLLSELLKVYGNNLNNKTNKFLRKKKRKKKIFLGNNFKNQNLPKIIPEWNDLKNPLFINRVNYKSPYKLNFDKVVSQDSIIDKIKNMHNSYFFSDELNSSFFGNNLSVNQRLRILDSIKIKFSKNRYVFKFLKIIYFLEFIYLNQGYNKFTSILIQYYLLGSYSSYLQKFIKFLRVWGLFIKSLTKREKILNVNNYEFKLLFKNSSILNWYSLLNYKNKINLNSKYYLNNIKNNNIMFYYSLLFNRFYGLIFDNRYIETNNFFKFIYVCDLVDKFSLYKINYIFYNSLNSFILNYPSKHNVLKNLNLGFVRINSKILTAPLISNYIVRNLKLGHNLNRIVYPMMSNAYKPWKQIIYRGWRIVGKGRFLKRGRAQKLFFKDGNLPLAMSTSWVDYSCESIILRNGMCSLKIFVTYKKLYIYNL